MASEFIPNSFQTPNAYVDRLMAYLTPEENTVLTYLCRRIFGFQKRTDRVAISQFVNGITDREGQALDHGTGLSKDGVTNALRGLTRFKIVVRLAENNPRNEGTLYALQLDSDAVDWDGLAERAEEKRAGNIKRNEAIRKARIAKGLPVKDSQPSSSEQGTQFATTPQFPQDAGGEFPQDAPPQFPQDNNIQGNTEKTRESDLEFLQTWREVTGYYPPADLKDYVYQILGSKPDKARLKNVWTTWIARDYKRRNIQGILDWYQNGIPDPKAANAAPPSPPRTRRVYADGTPA